MTKRHRLLIQKNITIFVVLTLSLLTFGIFTSLVSFENSWVIFAYVLTAILCSSMISHFIIIATLLIKKRLEEKTKDSIKPLLIKVIIDVIFCIALDYSALLFFSIIYTDYLTIKFSALITLVIFLEIVKLIFIIYSLYIYSKLANKMADSQELRKFLEEELSSEDFKKAEETLKKIEQIEKQRGLDQNNDDKKIIDIGEQVDKKEDKKEAEKEEED